MTQPEIVRIQSKLATIQLVVELLDIVVEIGSVSINGEIP
jgi:hypothetical protein